MEWTAKGLKVAFSNPLTDLKNSVDKLTDRIDAVGYWLNPEHALQAAWAELHTIIIDPSTAIVLIAGTIIGFMLIMLGAQWVKKWLFWGWVIYWVLRGFIFV